MAQCRHLGIDLLFLVPGESGGRETYARELLAALRAQRADLRITAFVNRETAAAGSWRAAADRAVVLPCSPRSRASWALGELALLPLAARSAGVEVLHSPANVAPLLSPVPRVVTVHDMLFEGRAAQRLVSRSARTAAAVLMGSAHARDELVTKLGLPARRVDVVHHGVATPVAPGDAAAARSALNLGARPLALVVGADLPHKNLDLALRGLAALPVRDRPVLAFAGRATDGPALRARAHAAGVQDQTRMLGVVTAQELESLFALASVVVSPARGEGFGLTVIEAMARGVPVACSDIAVSREVAGECAVFFDPREPRALAGALREIVAGGPVVERLVACGLERARRFTWTAAAQQTLAVYDRVLADCARGAP